MKLKSVLPALAGFVMLTGCEGISTPSLLSIESVAADSDLVSADGLTGVWENSGNMIVIRQDKDNPNELGVAFLGGGEPLGFEARSFRTGEALFLDLTPSSEGDDFRIPGHAIARVWLEGSTLRWCFLDSDWFKQQLSRVLMSYQTDRKMLLLSPGVSVRAAVARFGVDDQACGSIVSWSRLQ